MDAAVSSRGRRRIARLIVSRLLASAGLAIGLAGCHGAAQPAAPTAMDDGRAALAKKDYKDALSDFNAAIASGVGVDSRTYYDRGLTYYDLRNWSAADADFSEALKRAATDKELAQSFINAAYYYRGISRVTYGKYLGGKSDLILAVRAYPKDWLDWDDLGFARQQLGDFKGAVADYDRGIARWPKDANDLYNRGYSLYYSGNAHRAVLDFTSAIRLRPRWGAAYQMRGLAYAWRADFKHADPDYSMAIKLIPKAWSWEYRCEARESLNRVKEALYDCNHAVLYYPRWARALVARAWAKAILGNNQSALADANAAVKFARDYAPAYGYRGWIHVRLAQYRAAFADYNKALRVDRRDAQASSARASLATWLINAQNAGVRAYGIGSINVAQEENASEPPQSEYQARVSECGGYYSEGDSYYEDCIDKGVDEAKDDEAADHEAEQQAAEVGYNVEQQVQEDVNYEVAQQQEAQAAAEEQQSYESGGGGEEESGGGSEEEPQENYSEGGGETESEPVSEPEPEPESGGE
jgi:tetratricopeptide (TPR) repeat protein